MLYLKRTIIIWEKFNLQVRIQDFGEGEAWNEVTHFGVKISSDILLFQTLNPRTLANV